MIPRRQRKPSLKVREMQQAETDTQVPYLSATEAKRKSVDPVTIQHNMSQLLLFSRTSRGVCEYSSLLSYYSVPNRLVLNIQLNQFNCYIHILVDLTAHTNAQSKLKVISSWCAEGFGKIWRIVE